MTRPSKYLAAMVAVASLAALWLALRATARISPPRISIGGMTMGGTWSVKLRRLPASVARERVEGDIAALLDRLEGEMSIYRPDSDLSHFNDSQGTDWLPVPAELAEVVAESLRVSEQTGGAFDVTVAPLVNLWGFGPKCAGVQLGKIPSETEITAALNHVGYRRLQSRLSPPAMRKCDPELTVDLGGIGKGFAADKVGAYLDSLGVRDYLIAIGGELRARGSSADGLAWSVGIETPTPDTRRIFHQLELHDESLSTSGDYRNVAEIDGRRYCHEIDPHTGRPIERGPASVSVVHASGAHADAMATALMVLGADEGFELARRDGLAAIFILRGDGRFETRESPAFDRLKIHSGAH